MNKASEGKAENYEVSQEPFILQQTTKPSNPTLQKCQIQLSRAHNKEKQLGLWGANCLLHSSPHYQDKTSGSPLTAVTLTGWLSEGTRDCDGAVMYTHSLHCCLILQAHRGSPHQAVPLKRLGTRHPVKSAAHSPNRKC